VSETFEERQRRLAPWFRQSGVALWDVRDPDGQVFEARVVDARCWWSQHTRSPVLWLALGLRDKHGRPAAVPYSLQLLSAQGMYFLVRALRMLEVETDDLEAVVFAAASRLTDRLRGRSLLLMLQERPGLPPGVRLRGLIDHEQRRVVSTRHSLVSPDPLPESLSYIHVTDDEIKQLRLERPTGEGWET